MGFIYWNVAPELFRVGPLVVRWYGLLFALLFWIGYLLGRWMYRTEGKDSERLNDLLVYLLIGTVVGARLGHCLLYEPVFYLAHPLEILKVWKGGLASHGGAVGVLIALYLFSRRNPGESYLWLLDRVVVATALGGALIRLGNLFNSEILGLATTVPWAFVFERVDQTPRHPVQLYEALCYALIFVGLIIVYRQLKSNTPQGSLTGLFLLAVFTARFLLEFLKERQADYGQNLPLSVGQILSIPFILAGGVLLWRSLRRSARGASFSSPEKADRR